MGKLKLIILREINERVRNKGFWILSLLVPFILLGLMLTPLFINQSSYSHTEIIVYDETTIIDEVLVKHKNAKHITYTLAGENETLDDLIQKYDERNDILVLHIPENFIKNTAPVVQVFNKNAVGLSLIANIKNDLFDIRKKLILYSTTKFDLQDFEEKMKSPVSIIFQGEGIHPQLKFYVSFAGAILMYILVILYGVQVMRAVAEEKNNRIIEVIISSIHPKTLLKGKVFGVGIVGLIQFTIISVLASVLLSVAYSYFSIDTEAIMQQQIPTMNADGNIQETPNIAPTITLEEKTIISYIVALSSYFPILLFIVPLFFFGGYFLYASFFAAIGSALDQSNNESQVASLPVTMPIIASMLIALSVMNNPTSNLAFWASLFPLTSPVVMTARLPFMDIYADWWQIIISLIILGISIWWSLNFAGRVYKTGILLYGQKPNLRTIWKWYKNSN
jgi:ABC-2 type transport system permease protein